LNHNFPPILIILTAIKNLSYLLLKTKNILFNILWEKMIKIRNF